MGRLREDSLHCCWAMAVTGFLRNDAPRTGTAGLFRLSMLLEAGVRVLKTLRGSAILAGVSIGRLVSIGRTGEERRAVNSGELATGRAAAASGISSSGAGKSSATEEISGEEGGGSSTSTSGAVASAVDAAKSPERGGPGGSRSAVTAVQLSARSLFIIQ